MAFLWSQSPRSGIGFSRFINSGNVFGLTVAGSPSASTSFSSGPSSTLSTADDSIERKRFIADGPDLAHFLNKAPGNSNSADGEHHSNPQKGGPSQPPAYVDVNAMAEHTRSESRKAYIETYGCQMNVSDTEIVWSILQGAGYERTDSPIDADCILLNTCAIRENAENKVWHRLRYFNSLRTKRGVGKKAIPYPAVAAGGTDQKPKSTPTTTNDNDHDSSTAATAATQCGNHVDHDHHGCEGDGDGNYNDDHGCGAAVAVAVTAPPPKPVPVAFRSDRVTVSRRPKQNQVIGLLGCMAERLKGKLLEEDRLVDIVAGPDSYRDLPHLIHHAEAGNTTAINVVLSADESYADIAPVRVDSNGVSGYVSIMRGCNNMCSYCIVPFTRGRERSRPTPSILDEVRRLSDSGYKEVILLGQNVNSFCDKATEPQWRDPKLFESPDGNRGDDDEGDDLNADENASPPSVGGGSTPESLSSPGFRTIYRRPEGGLRFAELLFRVSQIDPEMRIRFTSPHPKDFPDPVLDVISETPNVCKQIHMPAQSGSTAMLSAMRRGYSREAYLGLVDHIRQRIPGVALSSDFISGFCGETEADHQDTLSLLRLVKYDQAFMFAYSMRERTHAHRNLVDDVPAEVKQRRLAEVIETFHTHVREKNSSEIGQIQLVLVEGTSKRKETDLFGRSDTNKKVIFPDVKIPARWNSSAQNDEPLVNAKIGDYIVVKISSASPVSMLGIPLGRSSIRDFAAINSLLTPSSLNFGSASNSSLDLDKRMSA